MKDDNRFYSPADPPEPSARPSRNRGVLNGLLAVAYPANLLCAGLSTGMSTGYIGQSLASDGLSALDICITAVSGAAFFAATVTLHHVGLRVLPKLSGASLAKTFKAWMATSALVIGVSCPTGVLFMAEPVAKAGQFNDQVQAALTQAAGAVEASKLAPALIPVALNAAITAQGMEERERCCAAIGGGGVGKGVITDALSSIRTLSISLESALVAARAAGAPLARRIEQLSDPIRRTVDDPHLSWAEKSAKAKDGVVDLIRATEELRQTAPLGPLQATVDGMSKDWRAAGINERASANITETFRPVATQLGDSLDELRTNAANSVQRFTEKSGFALLADRIPEVLPIAVFVLLLDVLPILIVMLVLTLSRRDDDLPPSDATPPGHLPARIDSRRRVPTNRSRHSLHDDD